MSRSLCILVGLLSTGLIFAQAPAPKAPAADAAIAGMVINSRSGEPLKRVQVTLTGLTGTADAAVTGMTDSSGKFRIGNLPPGTYRVEVSRNGFIRPHMRAEDSQHGPATLTLQPQQLLGDLVYRLTPGGVISGTVVDEDNTPISDVRMQCVHYSYSRAGRQIESCGFTTTDDRGQYRIASLSPGRYFLRASYIDPISLVGPVRGGVPEGYPSVFYPGVRDASQAGEIDIGESEEKSGIDFKMAPARAVHVQGQVRTADGRLGAGALITLTPRLSAGFSGRSPIQVGGDGGFRFEGVTAGSYMLSASLTGLRTAQVLDVGEADLDNVHILLSPRVDVRGHIRVEGDKKLATDGLIVFLLPADESTLMPPGGGIGKADANGNINFRGVPAGDYQVIFDKLPEDAYLKAVEVGNRPSEDMMFHFHGAAGATIEMVVSSAGGRVEGSLTDDQKQPISNTTVVLVPEGSRRSRTDLYRVAETDQYGRFSMRGVVPGDYKLFAWSEEMEAWSWMDPGILSQYENQGKSLSVTENSRNSVELQTIPVRGLP